MNKKLLSIAIAAAMVAPMVASADPTLYGRLRNALVYNDFNGEDEEWDVESTSSRFGVKGSEDLGNGLNAIYQYEFAVDSADTGGISGRLAFVGLTGGFGTLAIGRQWIPYYGSVNKVDVFDSNNFNDTYLSLYRVGNALAYVSPNFSGFSAKLALGISDDTEQFGDDNVDFWNPTIDYNNGPLSVGASYLSFEGTEASGAAERGGDGAVGDWDLWGLAAKYKFGDMFALIAQYEDRSGNESISDADEWTLLGEVYLGNNTIRAGYGRIDIKDVPVTEEEERDQWVLGFTHHFSKRTSVYADYEDSEGTIANDTDHDRFSLGLRHDF